jgi:transposase-like protein
MNGPGWKDVFMSRTRRSFATEYRVEAAHRVIDSGRTIAEVARALGVNEGLLGRWVADERRRVEAAAARSDERLTPAERTELARLRKQVAEQEKNIAFLKKSLRVLCRQPTESRPVRADGRRVHDHRDHRDHRDHPNGKTAGGVHLWLLQAYEPFGYN